MLTSDTQQPRALNAVERAELLQRFFQNTSLTPVALAKVDARGPCVLAVSGGRDSMLLCYVMAALWQAGHLQHAPRVFHLDHGLREESAADREFVGTAARVLDLPYSSTVRNVKSFARRTGASLEAAGRTLRYRLLERLRAWADGSWIVTAHHADDYVESLLGSSHSRWRSGRIGNTAGLQRERGRAAVAAAARMGSRGR